VAAPPVRTHRIVIGVMGAATCDEETASIAGRIGRAIAERGAVLLCGGRTGVMEAAARGARNAGGLVIGVLPGTSAADTPPNPHVDIALFTGMGDGRNWINACASDAVIAIGGGFGTLSEMALALKLGRPVVAVRTWRFDIDGTSPPVPRVDDPDEAVRVAFGRIPGVPVT
jgi:uncharacterized protein (TIGR00725 family)